MNWQIIVGVLLLIGGIANIASDFGAFLFGLLIGAALILWGLKRKGVRLGKAKTGTRQLTEEAFHVVGVSYYEAAIRKLELNNPKWSRSSTTILEDGDAGRRIFKHNYVNKPVKLDVEKNNPHDKNAVAVYVAGELVGYISRDDNVHVKDILSNREIISVSAFIGGGEYKIVTDTNDVIIDQMAFSVTVRIKYI